MAITNKKHETEPQNINADSKNEENTTTVKETATDRKTQIYNLIILDESGSMNSIMYAAISGFNETVAGIRSAQQKFAATQEHYVSLLTFCSCKQKMLYNKVPVEQVTALTDSQYSPCCCTPLYDAMGMALTGLYEEIKDKEDATAVVTVITDGLENASREYSGTAVKALVEKLTREEGWKFAYIGTNQDVEQVAAGLSINNYMFFHDNAEDMRRAWKQERNAKMRYFDHMNDDHCKCYSMPREDRKEYRAQQSRMEKFFMSNEDIRQRITPEPLTALQADEVLVYGFTRLFYKTPAHVCAMLEQYSGNKVGSKGRHQQCYCLRMSLLHADRNREAVETFLAHVAAHPEKKFMLTRIGMDFTDRVETIADMFVYASKYPNLYLPEEYWRYII